MKTKIKFLLPALFIMILLQFGCSKSTPDENCERCKLMEASKVNLTLGSYSGNFNLYDDPIKSPNVTLLLSYEKSSENLDQIFKQLNVKPNSRMDLEQLTAINLILKSRLNQSAKIELDDIQSALVYFKKNNQWMVCRSFINQNEKFIEDDSYRGSSAMITTNDLFKYARLNASTENYACISIINSSAIPVAAFQKGDFQILLEKKLQNTRLIGRESFCGPPCFPTANTVCYIGPEGPYCRAINLCAVGGGSGIDMVLHNSDSSLVFDEQNSEIYRFRDSILFQSARGKDYINYFYYLSSVLIYQNQLDLSYSLKAYDIIQNEMMPVIQSLKDITNDYEIVCKQSRAEKLIEFIKETKKRVNGNSYAEAICDQLIQDVHEFTDKTPNQILAILYN